MRRHCSLHNKGRATVNKEKAKKENEVRTQEGQDVQKKCRKRWGVNYYNPSWKKGLDKESLFEHYLFCRILPKTVHNPTKVNTSL